ncbi:hypothetical protein DW219_02015 [Desulfovibrio sp. AM18-2]|nr:hypothetical protein DW219_02015 [Desulfovibrio sp. AM18-2]
MSQSIWTKAADNLYGKHPDTEAVAAVQPPPGAADTSGGIEAALSVSPSEAQQGVRKAILNPVKKGNPDGMTAMSSADDSWKDALAGTLNDYGMGDAVDLYGNANVGPQLQAEPPTLAEDPNAKLREQMMEREVARSALRPVDGDAESGLVRATFMLNAASKHSQGDAMSAWQLSQKLGMPFDVTLDNLAAARLAGSEIVPDDIKSFAPAFLRLVQYDYDAAILWRHDLATANAVAESFSTWNNVLRAFTNASGVDASADLSPEGNTAAAGRGVVRAGLGVAQTLFTLGKAGIEGLGQAEGLGQSIADGIAAAIKPDALPVDKPATETPAISKWFGDMAQAATKAMGDISEDAPYAGKAIWDNPEVMLDSRWWLENGISTVISSVPAIAAYVASGGLAAAGAGFAMEAANMYNDLIAEGMPDNVGTSAWSAAYGVIAGALEATGVEAMLGGRPAVRSAFKYFLKESAVSSGRQVAKFGIARAGLGALGEGGTEWLQNVAQGVMESFAKGETGEQAFNAALDAAKELENFVLGGMFGGLMAGAGTGSAVRSERMKTDIMESIRRAANAPEIVAAREEIETISRESASAQARMAFAQSLEKAAAAADSSTMRQANPELFEQEAAKLIPQAARTVWLDVETLRDFVGDDPSRMAGLGLAKEAVDEAVATQAGSVPVRTLRLISQFSGEERQALLQSARTEPGGMTLAEAQAFDPVARSEEAANRIRSASQASAEVNKEKTRLKQEFVQAGYPSHLAEYYAAMHAEQAKAFADRYGMDAVELLRQRSVVQGNPEDVGAGALHHPLNAGVDLEAPVRVVTVQPQFEGKSPWELMKGQGKKSLGKAVVGAYTNNSTGWTISVTMHGAEHAISSATRRGVGGIEHLEAVANLPSLIENAVLVETHPDKKGQRLAAVHRMYAPMALGSDMYAVKLTVKEAQEGMVVEIEDVRKLYDLSLEKKMPKDLFAPSPDLAKASGKMTPTLGISEITLRRLLEGVNDHKDNRFFQPAATAGADDNNTADAQKQWAEKGTESPYFKQWFGDSKVVDKEGKPLVVYHGTGAEFESFDNKKTGANDGGLWGRGHYFSAVVGNANSYALRNDIGARVIPAYVSIKKPLILRTGNDLVTRLPDGSDYRSLVGSNLNGAKIKEIALEGGHDGIVQIKPDGLIGDLVAFSPAQIKSVFNRGTFDAADPRILYQQQRGAVSFGASGELEQQTPGVLFQPTSTKSNADSSAKRAYEELLGRMREKYGDGLYAKMTEQELSELEAKESAYHKDNGAGTEEDGRKEAAAQEEREEALKRWFGDSVVVGDDGEPLVLYHGTPSAGFDTFRREALGKTTGHETSKLGFFFSSKGVANLFASLQSDGQHKGVYPVYLKMERPYEISAEDFVDKYLQPPGVEDVREPSPIIEKNVAKLTKELKAGKYDGVIIRAGWVDGWEELRSDNYIVFSPEQIKSVYNSGTFDPNNPNILLQQQRGSVSFGLDGRSVTTIFEGTADPSTPIHEGAHVFINDLIRVVMDGGRIAEQRYASDFTATNQDTSIDDSLRRRRQDALTRKWNRHKNGLLQARKDLEVLVENANAQREVHGKAIGMDLPEVPLEAALAGTLTQEQMRTLQEVNATAFEGYVREGNAPSDRLKGVFHRMKEWLKSLYRSATVMGVKPQPEVARVFDRMLATDTAIRNSKAGAVMVNESDFLRTINGEMDEQVAEPDGEWTRKDRINYKAALNLEGDEAQRLQELYNLAEAEATARLDKETLRERNRRWRQYYKEGKETASDDIFYEIVAALTVNPDVPYSGISQRWLTYRYGKEAVKDFKAKSLGRKIINAKGGTALDAIGIADIVGGEEHAAALGFDDADAVYNYLYDNIVMRERTLARDARAYADQRLAEDDRIAEQAADDVPGAAYSRYLDEVEATVLRMAAREDAGWRTKEQQARWVEQNRMPLATVRRQVRDILRGKPLRGIMPNMYVGEVRTALQDRNAALLSGNARDALAAVDRARTALESWIEANRIIKEREAFERKAARLSIVKRGTMTPDAWEAIQNVLERFGTVAPRKYRGDAVPLRQVVEELAGADGAVQFGPAVADWLLDENVSGSYRDLDADQLQEVSDLLSLLEHAGREALAANLKSEAAKVEAVSNAAGERMANLKPDVLAEEGTWRRRWQEWSRKYFSGFAAFQWQTRMADGFTNLGPNGERGISEETLYVPLVQGESRLEVRLQALTARLAPVFTRLAESAKRIELERGQALMGADRKPLPVPEVMRQVSRNNWTPDMIISLALNLGNDGNVQRLRDGYQDLTPEVVSRLLGDDATRLLFKGWAGVGSEGVLSPQDWKDIQEIWDTLHTQWADITATHKRMYGFKPPAVEARPFSLNVGGQVISLQGGYYPVVYDPQLSRRVAAFTEKQDALARGDAVYAIPSARKGFTKARAESGRGAPLLLSTNVIMRHLSDVGRFVELAEAVRFADRVTQSPGWRQGYIRAFGKAEFDAIRPNLKNMVLEETPPQDAFSIAAEWARSRLIPWGLAWNIKTALLQGTALFPAMNDLGAVNVMRGVSAVGLGGMPLVREIWEASPYMESRGHNIDQDLRQAVKGIDKRTREKVIRLLGVELTWDKVVEAGMQPLLAVDMATSSAVWMAAYNREMARLMGERAGKRGIDPSSEYHKAAVLAADMAVKAVNPDFNPSSRSEFLRTRGMARLVNMFSSAVVLFAQRRAYNARAMKNAVHQAPSLGGKAYAVANYVRYEAYDFLLPAVAMGLLQGLVAGDDEPEKYAKKIGNAYMDAAAMRLPLWGGLVSAMATNETWRGAPSVLEQPFRLAGRLAGAVHKSDTGKMASSMADVISFNLRVPASRLYRNWQRGYDQWQRGDGTPLSVVMPSPGR